MKAPLSVTHPELAAEWHPTKNGDLTPEKVTFGSIKRVWWQCSRSPSHQWETTVNSRTNRHLQSGCPYCAGKKVSATNSLAVLFPEISAQWHSTKNGNLTPEQVVAGSETRVWWLCPKGPDHEWQTTVSNRTNSAGGRGCPYCSGQKVSVTNSLASLFARVAEEWHATKNGNVTPEKVVAGSNNHFWWQCSKHSDHVWKASVSKRTTYRQGCPYCAGKRVSLTNSLTSLFPDIAAEWHPTKNGPLTPDQIVAGSEKKVWWQCPRGSDHEWEGTSANRTRLGIGCPYCAGKKVSVTNSLVSLFPDLISEWHPVKNNELTPDQVVAGSEAKVWWKCPKGPDHEWQTTVAKRTAEGHGCPFCSGQKVSAGNCLAFLYPNIAAEWHPIKNGGLRPEDVTSGSSQRVWWRCPKGPDHEWQTSIGNRTKAHHGCPYCAGQKGSVTNSLASLFPGIAGEWHPTKNGNSTPEDVTPGSGKNVWWRCRVDPSHQWQATIASRTNLGSGCPVCNRWWTVPAIRVFVASLKEHLRCFTPAELHVLFQQTGVLGMQGKGKAFVNALTTGRFPREEIDKFISGTPSLADAFFQNPSHTLESVDPGNGKAGTEGGLPDRADELVGEASVEDQNLPVIQTKDVLASLGHQVVTSADEEAVDFLLASGVAKIWKHAYQDEKAAVAQTEVFQGDGYAEQVRTGFLEEYRQAKDLHIPAGYSFTVNGKRQTPNLMQRHFAVRVRERKRVGNWSGTGAGKTLAAVLATRMVGSTFTVVCCPNSVVEGWRQAILVIFPDSMVATKTFEPDWRNPSPQPSPPRGEGVRRAAFPRREAGVGSAHRYLVLNYEAFQQPDSAERVRSLVEREAIDFIIVDEIHFAKQRGAVEDISLRRKLVMALVTSAGERNTDLHVLGMSATPVINNLQEGKSMVELVSGLAHDEIDTRPTVPNCMKLHQRLLTLGIRWMPDYKKLLGYECKEERVEVDCRAFLDEVRALGDKGTPLALEQVLTRARLPVILQHVKRKTLIYTYYIEGIDRLLRDALVGDGWKVGFYTGDDKSGKDAFIDGDLDVLIATAAIGTGVDGLQYVCNRLIINVLPWTRAEYDQLLGRIYRQGQRDRKQVTVIIPLTYAEVNGQRWSWCESKMQRLAFKKSIADAAVDGVVPEGHLRSPAQAYQDVMAWLQRLETGQVQVVTRSRIVVPLPDTNPTDVKRRQRRYGDFSAMNHTWNRTGSEATHARLQANPEEWDQTRTRPT